MLSVLYHITLYYIASYVILYDTISFFTISYGGRAHLERIVQVLQDKQQGILKKEETLLDQQRERMVMTIHR
jgi:hypothetical protein